jgi:hypothetical protein
MKISEAVEALRRLGYSGLADEVDEGEATVAEAIEAVRAHNPAAAEQLAAGSAASIRVRRKSGAADITTDTDPDTDTDVPRETPDVDTDTDVPRETPDPDTDPDTDTDDTATGPPPATTHPYVRPLRRKDR